MSDNTFRHEVSVGARTIIAYDAPVAGAAGTLVWHHGSPHTGVPLGPVVAAAHAAGLRLVTYARPSYGGSTPSPGRTIADGAVDVQAVTDALGIDTFVTAGHSGGGPHALACGALLADRVSAVAAIASVAPYTQVFDWYAGMKSPAALRSARAGRGARAAHALIDDWDDTVFNDRDWAALGSAWRVLADDAAAAGKHSTGGLIDDDVAVAADWGFDVTTITAPVLLPHGGDDRMVPVSHGQALAHSIDDAELWLRPRDGHIAIMATLPLALRWLRAGGAPV